MSRFEWLEIPKGSGAGAKPPDEVAGFDEQHYLELGDAKSREGELETAMRYYSRALDRDLRLEPAWLGQLLCLVDLGEFREAITWADKALELCPGSAGVFALKGLAWGRLGDMEKARGFSDTSLRAGDRSSLVWWARGDILMSENVRNASFCFRKALELAGDDGALNLRIGRSFMSLGQAHSARPYLLHARNLQPENPLAWYWLGVAYQESGQTGEAGACFEHALELRPGKPEFQQAHARVARMGLLDRLWWKLSRIWK